MDESSVALLAERVGQQLDRATHVVLDLHEVRVLRGCGVRVLADLHEAATTCGSRLHVVGIETEAVGRPLRLAGLDRVLSVAASADAVIALRSTTSAPIRRTATGR